MLSIRGLTKHIAYIRITAKITDFMKVSILKSIFIGHILAEFGPTSMSLL